jgi:hypothetical protein
MSMRSSVLIASLAPGPCSPAIAAAPLSDRRGLSADRPAKAIAFDLAHNPADNHSKLVFDPAVRGHTDHFLFRFPKPR